MAATFALAIVGATVAFPQEPPDVVLDLLKTPAGAEQDLEARVGEFFRVRLENRAPSARYRVRAQLILSPETRSRPSANAMDQTYELPTPAPHQLQSPPESHPCLAFKRDLVALQRTIDEATVASQYQSLRKRLDQGECPSLGAGFRYELEAIRTRLNMGYSLYPGDEVRVTLDRIDPATGSAARTWRAVIRVAVPKLPWAYATEEEWIIGETARDVVEMLVYAKTRSLPDPAKMSFGLAKAKTPAIVPPTYQLSVEVPGAGVKLNRDLVIDHHVWSPRLYAGVAADLVRQLGLPRPEGGSGKGGAAEALTRPQALVIEKENQRISSWLASRPLDPSAHEDAALLLAAFGLREAAGSFWDVRHTLSRLAAHLSLARALRGEAAGGTAGMLAEAALASMAGREKEAVELLDALEARATLIPAERAWARALRIRTTGDWRLLKAPGSATELEQIQLYRELGACLGAPHALNLLRSLHQEPTAELASITLQGFASVAAGSIMAPLALPLEMKELAEVLRAARGEELKPDRMKDVLAARAGRCIGRDAQGVRPKVIDWGAWAEFYERHVCHAVASLDHHVVTMLGQEDPGGELRRQEEQVVEGLALGPVLAQRLAMRKRSSRSGIGPGDSEVCAAGASLARNAPERLEMESWELLDRMCAKERETGALPSLARWFEPRLPAGTGYAVGWRARTNAVWPWMRGQMKDLVARAPYQTRLLQIYSHLTWGDAPKGEDLGKLYGPLKEYDLWVMGELARAQEDDVAAARPLYQRMAELDPDSHLALADYLSRHGLEGEAAAAYEEAVSNAENRVALSQHLGWLVDYYLDRGKEARARELAALGAEVHSYAGLFTMARLLERMERYDEAEAWYKKNAEAYKIGEGEKALKWFYVRYELRHKDSRFRVAAQAALRDLFPAGLEHIGLADFVSPAQPADGPMLQGTLSAEFRRLGLKAGDQIVALDGYRMRNWDQYTCVLGFADAGDATLIVWSGGRYREVKGLIKRRKFGPPRSGA
jgi:hypothetical protein